MAEQEGHHEAFGHDGPSKRGSDRSFGIVFAVIFMVIALLPLWHEEAPRVWALILAAAFLGVALMRPALLSPLNRVWLTFGALLHRIVSPVVMAGVFYLMVTPIGLLMRILGKRPIPLRFDRDRSSYWIEREPPGPAPDTMKNQF